MNKSSANLNFGVIGDFNHNPVFFDICNFAKYSPGDDNMVARFQSFNHGVMQFLTLALWRNNQEPHPCKHEEHNKKEPATAALRISLRLRNDINEVHSLYFLV